MLQTKLGSFYEACLNILIGYTIASAANYLVLPFFLEGVTVGNSLLIGLIFTVISLIRTYVIRRWFNHRARIKELETIVNYYKNLAIDHHLKSNESGERDETR